MPVFLALLVLQWLHILGGITWFGSYIFLDFILWPILWNLPVSKGKHIKESIFTRCSLLFRFVGPLVVLLGVIQGTLFGPIRSWQFLFGTSYGITWSIALLIGIGLLVWGTFWHVYGTEPIWEGEKVSLRAVRRLKFGFFVETCSFSIILICMVLLHFGY